MPLILLSFTPFAAFNLLSEWVSVEVGVMAAALLALGLIMSDWLRPDGSAKALELGSAALFCALAAYIFWRRPADGLLLGRLVANGGLTAIALVSLAMGKPFSLQYARETAAQDAINSPDFLRDNYVITLVWTAIFGFLFAASVWTATTGVAPGFLRRALVYSVLIGGFVFTAWYVERLRNRQRSGR